MDVGTSVASVESYGQSAAILFEDGKKVVFEGYSHGFGYQLEGLRTFELYDGDKLIFHFDGRLHYGGPSEDEYRVVPVVGGCSIQMALNYWQAARRYLNDKYFKEPRDRGEDEGPRELWFPWRLQSLSGMPAQYMLEGILCQGAASTFLSALVELSEDKTAAPDDRVKKLAQLLASDKGRDGVHCGGGEWSKIKLHYRDTIYYPDNGFSLTSNGTGKKRFDALEAVVAKHFEVAHIDFCRTV